MVGGGTQIPPALAAPSPVPKAISPSPGTRSSSEAQGQAGAPQCPTEGHEPLAGPPRAAPGDPWPRGPGRGTPSTGVHRSTLQSELPRDMGHHTQGWWMGCREKHLVIARDLLWDVWGGDQRQGNDRSG